MTTQRDRHGSVVDAETDEAVPRPYGLGRLRLPVQWRWLLPIAVVASTAAWSAGVVSGLVHGELRLGLITAGAVLTATAAGVPLWVQVRTERARVDAVAAAQDARAAMRLAMEDALDPIIALLLQLATAKGTERTRIRGQATLLTLTTIAQLGIPKHASDAGETRRLRVCYFAVEQGPPRRLVPQAYAGRAGEPTLVLDETTRAGQFLLRTVDDGWQVVDDMANQRSAVWWDEERTYRTFAAGPVPGPDGAAVGLLTIDGLVPGELDNIDLPLVRLLADLLALALVNR